MEAYVSQFILSKYYLEVICNVIGIVKSSECVGTNVIVIENLEEYIYYYNNERISLKLKGMGPVQYQAHSQAI